MDRSTLGVAEKCFQSSIFTGPIMLQPSCPLRTNNLEERACLSEEDQTYNKVAQEALYVQIPKTVSRGSRESFSVSMCKSLCSYRNDEAQQVSHCQLKWGRIIQSLNTCVSYFKSHSSFTKKPKTAFIYTKPTFRQPFDGYLIRLIYMNQQQSFYLVRLNTNSTFTGVFDNRFHGTKRQFKEVTQ